MKIVLSTLAAVMIASASFAGAALADGDYYQGVSRNQASAQTNGQVDNVKTGSVSQNRVHDDQDSQSIFQHTSRDNR